MTTDQLSGLKRSYRAGTVSKNDQERLMEELIERDDRTEKAKSNLRETATNAVQTFLETLKLE